MIRWMSGREQSLRYWSMLRVAPPARTSLLHSEAFRQTTGLTDTDGTVWVHPMPAERFADRAAWMLENLTPDAGSGVSPAFVPVGRYQKDLEDAIDAMLRRAVSPDRHESLEDLLSRAAARVHQVIARDRAARGREGHEG
jgi:hypothetical protein